jgi:dienelactone hydrolase
MWDTAALAVAPKTYPADPIRADGMKALFFDGLPYQGKPTRIFAWLGVPKVEPGRKVPGIVLVHGGVGTAFENWVRRWTERGYAAIAFDTCGAIPLKVADAKKWQRHDAGGPPGWGGWEQIETPREDQWTYHAVADALLAHSLLRAQPEVDPERIGITGISWGGYLTSIIAGVDARLKFAAPVYGCGFTNEHGFAGSVEKLGPEGAARWMRWWDPSAYLAGAKMPVLWVNGTNDFAYTMNAWQKSYRLPSGPRTLCLRLRMPHAHGPAGEGPTEILAFAESIVNGGTPLPKIIAQGREGRDAWATFAADNQITKAELLYTKDTGPWQKRLWETAPAEIAADGKVRATLPEGTTVFYLNLTDDRDCVVSTEHEEVAP